jgi:hypothetical protein
MEEAPERVLADLRAFLGTSATDVSAGEGTHRAPA